MDVIDEIVENDNIDESLLQQSPDSIDELDDPIVPEVPKTIAGQQLFVYLPNASNDNLGLVEGSYKQRMLLTTDKKVLVDIVDGTIQNIYIKQNYAQEITWLKLNDYFKLIQDLINNITSGTTIVDKADKDSQGNVITDTYVSIKPQVFTEEQKAQARINIGAGSAVATIVKINGNFVPILKFTSDPQTQINTNTNAIETEIANRTSADETLQSNIDNKLDKTTDAGYRVYASNNKVNSTLAYSSNANINSVVYRDANGRSKIQDPADELDIANKKYVDGLVATEISNRETSDSSLQEQINELSQDLSTETTNRTNSDTTLQSNINTVSSNLSGEISNRKVADENLQTQVNTNTTNISTNTTDISGLKTSLATTNENVTENTNNITSNTTEINSLKTSLSTTNSNVTQNANNIATNASDIDDIEAKIPTQASSTNQLADKNFVNSSINNIAAFYITSNASGDAFESYAQLSTATVFYSGGQSRTPTRNDYCIVRTDENHNNATTRYIYQVSQWEFQYIVNETPLTAAQVAAINSGITEALVQQIGSNTSARHTHTNKSLLDTYSQTEANLSDAVAKKHLHSNKSILDATTASFTTQQQTKLAGIQAGAQVNTVTSVNNKTGAVNLTASDVGALPSSTTIPTVNNGKLTIRKNGTDVGSFTANQSNNTSINIKVPTTASDVGALPDTTDYLKSATVSNNELIITKQDDTSITFQGGENKANVDASNISTDNVTSWQQKLITSAIAGNGISIVNGHIDVDVDVETKPVDETYTIASEMWRALSGNDPYKFMASVTAEYTIGTKTEVGTINDQPALFANYGFVVGSVSNQTVIIFAVSKPADDVNLSVRFRG